jgi:hypothetical protein
MSTEVNHRRVLLWLALFGVAMGYFEAALVVYLRELLYPEGFTFPLRAIPPNLLVIEIAREASTMAMLVAVAALAARRFWARFAVFLFVFGIWDIFYYVWLYVAIDWPSSLLTWDILFLIPLPWIAPVIAPVLVAGMMIFAGCRILGQEGTGVPFRPDRWAWLAGTAGTIVILWSFMVDTGATLHGQLPEPYKYHLLVIGLALYTAGLVRAVRNSKRTAR